MQVPLACHLTLLVDILLQQRFEIFSEHFYILRSFQAATFTIGDIVGGHGTMHPNKLKTFHRNLIFAIENHLSLAKWPP